MWILVTNSRLSAPSASRLNWYFLSSSKLWLEEVLRERVPPVQWTLLCNKRNDIEIWSYFMPRKRKQWLAEKEVLKNTAAGRKLEKLLWFGRGSVYNSIFALESKFIPFLLFFKKLHRFPFAFLVCEKKIANPVTWNLKQVCSNLRLQPLRIWVSLTHPVR